MLNAELTYDVLIIGCGLYGIQAARTYLEIHPRAHVAVLEGASSVGGVWSTDRNYDDFWTQTPIGMAKFSDQKMHHIPDEEQYYGFFKAANVSSYLESYVESRVYNGSSMSSRICYNTVVRSIARKDDLWAITVNTRELPLMTKSIIDATGLTSCPNIPQTYLYAGFEALVIHHKDFGSKGNVALENPEIKHITVIGGAKSAADMAYAAAKARKSVTWLIRRSGRGPSLFVPAKGSGSYKNSNDFFYTRLTSLFLASLWTVIPFWLRWLYRSTVGMKIFDRMWTNNNNKVVAMADYDRADGQANGFYNLRPDTELFWQNDSTSINQRPDFFDVIARLVKIYRQDIKECNGRKVILEDGTEIITDVVLLGTGWKASHPHVTPHMADELGLPVDTTVADLTANPKSTKDWLELLLDSERSVLSEFPILKESPNYFAQARTRQPSRTPFKLWQAILPIPKDSSTFYASEGKPNIVFVGKVILGNHFRAAEVQALFAVAALDGNICTLKNHNSGKQQKLMERDVAKAYAWCRRRYPGKVSELGNYYYFDMIPYTDNLLETIGLKSHRNGSWWQNLLRPCRASDLRGCIQEYKDIYQSL